MLTVHQALWYVLEIQWETRGVLVLPSCSLYFRAVILQKRVFGHYLESFLTVNWADGWQCYLHLVGRGKNADKHPQCTRLTKNANSAKHEKLWSSGKWTKNTNLLITKH